MFDHTLSPDEIERIRQERKEADTHYNDALTLLDRVVAPSSVVPAAPPALDEEKLPAINDGWRILSTHPVDFGSGWRARLAGLVWRLVGPLF